MRPVTSTSWTVDQTSHRLVCDALRQILRQGTQTGPGAVEDVGSMLYQVSAVLYQLLLDHPIDQRGRCRSCRRPGARIAFRRRCCLIHLRASHWLLHQPDKAMLLGRLADELGLGTRSPSSAGTLSDRSGRTVTTLTDSHHTDVAPTVVGDPRADPLVIIGDHPWPR